MSAYKGKNRLFKVYHIHEKGNDNLEEGYVGVTRHSLPSRLCEHFNSKRPVGKILRELGREAVEITQLAILPREEALQMEYELRPQMEMGWNTLAGGNYKTLRCSICGKPMPHKPKKTKYCWECYKKKLDSGEVWPNSAGKGEHFIVTAPDGTVYEPIYFTQFCRERDLTPQNLRKVAKGLRKHHKGWTARYAHAH